MKCNICGQEFGVGANCQHCGTDRVTAGANADGYTIPTQQSNQEASQRTLQHNERLIQQHVEESTICPFCGEIIPKDADYCPYCSRKQKETCPRCNNLYSAKYPACPKCGTNREQFYAEEERRKQEAALEKKKEEEKRKQQEEALSRFHAEEERRLQEMVRRQKESFLSKLELPSEIPHAIIDSPIEIKIEKGIGKVSFGMNGKEVTDVIGAPEWYNVQDYSTREYRMRYSTKTEEVSTVDLQFVDDKLLSIAIRSKFPLSKGLCIELFNTRMKWFDLKMLTGLFKQHKEELPYGFIVRNNKIYCGASFFDSHSICLKQTLGEEKNRVIKEQWQEARLEYGGSREELGILSDVILPIAFGGTMIFPGLINLFLFHESSWKKAFLVYLVIVVVVYSVFSFIIPLIHNHKVRKKIFKEFALEKYGFKIKQLR